MLDKNSILYSYRYKVRQCWMHVWLDIFFVLLLFFDSYELQYYNTLFNEPWLKNISLLKTTDFIYSDNKIYEQNVIYCNSIDHFSSSQVHRKQT
jgi:hypothetical protein